MKEIRLKVPDMSCGHCEAAVRGALERVEGVDTIHVSLDTHTVTVQSIVELEAYDLMTAVKAAGYSPELDS